MAQTLHAASASYTDVNTQYTNAHDGDTIVIPGGPAAHWTEQLIVSKAIKIKGATTISGAGTVGCTANDQTIIIGDAVGKSSLFKFQTSAAQDFNYPELSGITFRKGTANIPKVICSSTGTGPVRNLRVHDCHNDGGNFVVVSGWNYGLADHNLIFGNDQAFLMGQGSYGGKLLGHGAWADYPWYGTYRFFFVEDNTFISDAPNGISTGNNIDGENGARFVARYNYWHNCRPGWHGTESGNRGTRAVEVYNNHFHWQVTAPSSSNRSGTSLYHDNLYDGQASNNDTISGLHNFRSEGAESASYVFGFADGTSPWDSNDPHGLYYSGTATGGTQSGSTATVTVAGTPWTSNEWYGFSIKQITGLAAGKGTYIATNTQSEILYIYYGTTDRGPTLKFVAGNTFQIHKCLVALDQNGRGKGDLLSGNMSTGFVNTVLGGEAWPRQAIEPCYQWNNHYQPTDRYYSFGNGVPTQIEDREFFNLGHVTETNGAPPVVVAKYVAGLNGENYDGPYTYPHPLQGNVTPIISSSDNTDFIELSAGSFQMETTGFSGSVTFSKTGTLPSGVTLNSSGLLSGTPVAASAGTYNITVTATDGTSSDNQPFTLRVSAAVTKVIALSGSMAFGNVTVNTTVNQDLTITNNGNTALAVTNITYPSGFTGNISSVTIAPGASQIVTVTFAPVAGTSYSGTITVVSDKTSGTNTVAASGTGITRIIGLSGSLVFGSITVNQTATRQLVIANTGTGSLAITSILYPEGFSGDFSTATIAAGATKTLNVTFSPLAAQVYSGQVVITSNATSGTSAATASGTGTVSSTKIIELTGSLDFGNVQTTTTVTRVLTITNSGNATLAVSGITYPTGFTGAFSGNILAGASHDVNVVFAPVSGTSYGGDITVASDATDGIDTIATTGVGVVPATKVIALSGSLAFGNVLLSTSPTRTLTITNNGSALLTVSGITYPTGYTGAYSGTIAAGASQDVTVTFTPVAAQSYNGTITVASDKTSGTNTIAVTGAGVSPTTRVISITGDLAFGNVRKNHSAQRIMTITNTGTASLIITSITYPSRFTGNYASGTILPGASQQVTVTFTPNDFATFGGTITVASNKSSGTNTIVCSGTGTNKQQVPFYLIVI